MPTTTITIMKILERISKGANLPDLDRRYEWSAVGMCNDLDNLYRNYPSHVITVTQDENIGAADSDRESEVFFNLDHHHVAISSTTSDENDPMEKTPKDKEEVKLFAVKSHIPSDHSLWIPVIDIFESHAEDILIKSRVYPGSSEWRTYKRRLNKVKKLGTYQLWLTHEEYQDYNNEMVCLADNNELPHKEEAVILPFSLRKPYHKNDGPSK